MFPALRSDPSPPLRLTGWQERASSVFLQALAYCSGLAAVAGIAAYLAEAPRSVIAASVSPPRPDWVAVERPWPAFALSIPEAGDAPASYAILRHADGGGRKDVLTLGEPAGEAPSLTVEIYRPGREIARFGEAARAIAARAASLGPAGALHMDAMRMEDDLDTKFGRFAVATFSIEGAAPRRCTGFVHTNDDPRLQIAGTFCQGGEPVTRAMLSCALDRLTLVAAGSDQKTAALFAHAELHRSFCGQRSPLMAPTPKYQTLWKALEQRQRAAAR